MQTAKLMARILLAAFAYVVSMVLAGTLNAALHLPAMKGIPGISTQQVFFSMVLSLPILILGMLPLVWGFKGSGVQRWFAVAVLLYVTLGLNTLIEAKIFTGLLDGSPFAASLFWITPAALTAFALTYRFGETQSTASVLGKFGAAGWTWRLSVAWLLWPVIYFVFGMCVGPFVVPYYKEGGVLGLHIPGFDVIIGTQLLRSAIFLAASFPAILLWTKSRGWLIFALGLAHAVTVGLFQLAQAPFFPTVMRVAHSLEITADSFAYAAVLTLLFTQRARTVKPHLQTTSAAAD